MPLESPAQVVLEKSCSYHFGCCVDRGRLDCRTCVGKRPIGAENLFDCVSCPMIWVVNQMLNQNRRQAHRGQCWDGQESNFASEAREELERRS